MLLLDEEEEVGPDFVRAQMLGRLAEVLGERGDPVDVGLDGPGREIAEFHVLDHSLTQRCHDVLLSTDQGGDHVSLKTKFAAMFHT